jgi:hypothetical protein
LFMISTVSFLLSLIDILRQCKIFLQERPIRMNYSSTSDHERV